MRLTALSTKAGGRTPPRRSWGAALLGATALLCLHQKSSAATLLEPQPRFSFGLIADVQYADKDSIGERRYRESLAKLDACLTDLNHRPLTFLANLGDSIDGRDDQSMTDLERVLEVFARSRAPVHHVVGNHCLEVPRRQLLPALNLTRGYYSFQSQGWEFLVLDSMDVSLKAEVGTQGRLEAEAWVKRNPQLPTYNGAVGEIQLSWLKAQLAEARQAQRSVVVFSHHPLATVPGHQSLLLWNANVVREALVEAGCVVACFAGHDHVGAYVLVDGIHYLTLPGMVEAPTDGNRYAVVDVWLDRLEFRGLGDVPSRTLRFGTP